MQVQTRTYGSNTEENYMKPNKKVCKQCPKYKQAKGMPITCRQIEINRTDKDWVYSDEDNVPELCQFQLEHLVTGQENK